MKLNHKGYVILLLFCLTLWNLSIRGQGAVGEIQIETEIIAEDLDTPWEILWGPDDHIWLTERYGRISRLDPTSGEVTTLLVVGDVHEESESGLLGMALHPNFSEFPFVYVVYNYFEGSIHERVARYTYNGSELTDPLVLLDNVPGNRTHNGSRIIVGPDSMLYFSLGDVGVTSNSQNLSSVNGKILRMDLDGNIPEDNPFPGSYVWSFGHRNPQGMVFTPDGILYSSEHGPQTDDEVNKITKGMNYGWPDVEGFCNESTEITFCNANNVIEPLVAWTPTLAVAGLDYYPYDLIPSLQDHLLLVALRTGKFLSLNISEDGNEILSENSLINGELGRLRDVCISPDGRVFISTSNRDGRGTPQTGDDKIIEIKAIDVNSAFSISPENFTLYPNPASDEFIISRSIEFNNAEYKVVDPAGMIILNGYFSGKTTNINVSDLVEGFYLVQVIVDNKSTLKSLIIFR